MQYLIRTSEEICSLLACLLGNWEQLLFCVVDCCGLKCIDIQLFAMKRLKNGHSPFFNVSSLQTQNGVINAYFVTKGCLKCPNDAVLLKSGQVLHTPCLEICLRHMPM